ncbi:MAG TPA: NAD(P)H-hydrate dehydratase [Acidimicrobiia bacterium]|nr:NAD(P)H-hydrate dehydratase [Acidimicrobiia bacterium]
MIPVVTAAEAARMDQGASDPVDVLMDRAGLAVALEAADMGMAYGSRVVVLCGPGNNGGDGYVAARYLRRRGVDVRVEALADPKTEAARHAADAARTAGVPIGPLSPPGRADLIIDAIFGGGFRRGLPAAIRDWMDTVLPVLAVDVPTGVDPDTGAATDGSFAARRTVTFGGLKRAHLAAPEICGLVTVADIGLAEGDPVLRVVEDADADRPSRAWNAHKWSAGSVLTVGGSEGMVGAAVMAGRAALHFGAGAVGVASAQPQAVATLAPELLTYPLEDVDRLMDRYDVVLVGPGLGDLFDIVAQVMRSADKVVVDADALRSLDALTGSTAELVITPHAGEFGRLSDEDPGSEGARRLAEAIGGVVLLKGWPTFVTDGGTPWAIVSGGAELATIGTGDVLAGMTAALWARGLSPLEAARSAAHWHGVAAADLAQQSTVTADRLASHVGRWSGV